MDDSVYVAGRAWHPVWCSPKYCCVDQNGGTHVSESFAIGPDKPAPMAITGYMYRVAASTALTRVVMEVDQDEGDPPAFIILSPHQAQHLIRALTNLVVPGAPCL